MKCGATTQPCAYLDKCGYADFRSTRFSGHSTRMAQGRALSVVGVGSRAGGVCCMCIGALMLVHATCHFSLFWNCERPIDGLFACKHGQTKRSTGTSAWHPTVTLAPMTSATNGHHSRLPAQHRVYRSRVHHMSGRWLEGRSILLMSHVKFLDSKHCINARWRKFGKSCLWSVIGGHAPRHAGAACARVLTSAR